MLKIVEEIIDKELKDLTIVLTSGILEKIKIKEFF